VLRGRSPSVERTAEICRALGLEFYIGPRRDEGTSIEKINRALGLPEPTEVEAIIEKIESLNRWDPEALQKHLDDAEAALEKWRLENLAAMAEIARRMQANPDISVAEAAQGTGDGADDAVDDDRVFQFPSRDATGLVDDEALARLEDVAVRPVMVLELEAAAGGGALVLDESTAKPIYFRREWLDRHALDAARCRVIGVMGNSMEPTLPNGCRILVDRERRRRLSGRIFVIRTGDGVMVKRLARDGDGGWRLVSDNDSPDWPDVPWPDEAEVIGQVKWMAQTFK